MYDVTRHNCPSLIHHPFSLYVHSIDPVSPNQSDTGFFVSVFPSIQRHSHSITLQYDMKNLLSAACLTVAINSDVTNQSIEDPQQKESGTDMKNKIDDSYWLCQSFQYGESAFIAVPSPYVDLPQKLQKLGKKTPADEKLKYKDHLDQELNQASIHRMKNKMWPTIDHLLRECYRANYPQITHGEMEHQLGVHHEQYLRVNTWDGLVEFHSKTIVGYNTPIPGLEKVLLDMWCAYSLGDWKGAHQNPKDLQIHFTEQPFEKIHSFNMVTNIAIEGPNPPGRLSYPRWTSISRPVNTGALGQFRKNPMKETHEVGYITAIEVKTDHKQITKARKE